jgi:TatD DNase family protein
MHLIDTHCHLTNARFDADRAQVIANAADANVVACIVIGTGIADAEAGIELARQYPQLRLAAGLDPFSCHEAGAAFATELARLQALLERGDHCALGEIGLEYFHTLLPHDVQIAQFEELLALAERLDLPVVIHVRDAHEDMIATLRRHPKNRGVIHSYIGDADTARRYLDLGYHLSFNGTLTFKPNEFLRQAAAIVPNDRLLIETDSPYLAPVPLRGRRCEPAYVTQTLSLLAEVRGQRVEDLAAWTTRNAVSLFRLKNIPL